MCSGQRAILAALDLAGYLAGWLAGSPTKPSQLKSQPGYLQFGGMAKRRGSHSVLGQVRGAGNGSGESGSVCVSQPSALIKRLGNSIASNGSEQLLKLVAKGRAKAQGSSSRVKVADQVTACAHTGRPSR